VAPTSGARQRHAEPAADTCTDAEVSALTRSNIKTRSAFAERTPPPAVPFASVAAGSCPSMVMARSAGSSEIDGETA
jgi:hypothetical protein